VTGIAFGISEAFRDISFILTITVIVLCPSSGILKNTKEHNVLETASVFVIRRGTTRPMFEVSYF
jgi:hypothetical protein